jgi:hypothetical protein
MRAKEQPEASDEEEESQRHRRDVEQPVGGQCPSPNHYRRIHGYGCHRHEAQPQAGTWLDVADQAIHEIGLLFMEAIPIQSPGTGKQQRRQN